jgi:hypothetical protein
MYVSEPWYTSATTIGWTAIAVAVIFGVAGILLWWLGKRKRLLVYTVESASLLLTNEFESGDGGGVEIRARGRAVNNPHFVTLTIASHSGKDIRDADFDGGKPLIFHFGVAIVAANFFPLDNRNPPEVRKHLMPSGSHGPPSDMIEIMPSLIRDDLRCQLRLITEDEPDVTDTNPIADVTVRRGTPAKPKLLYAAIGALATCLLFEGVIIANPRPGWPEILIAIFLLLAATVIGGELVMAWRRRPFL